MEAAEWFNSKFIDTCLSNGVEPLLTGDNVLVLVCPKIPPEEVRQKILSLVPEGQPSGFAEFICSKTQVIIRKLAQNYGAEFVALTGNPDGRIRVEIEAPEGRTAADPENPLWGAVAFTLRLDAFVKEHKLWEIYVNGHLALNSEGMKPSSPPTQRDDEESFDESFQDESKEVHPRTVRSSKAIKINDGRFNYDRDYLSKDAVTDLKILLGSNDKHSSSQRPDATGDSGEFLRSLGVQL